MKYTIFLLFVVIMNISSSALCMWNSHAILCIGELRKERQKEEEKAKEAAIERASNESFDSSTLSDDSCWVDDENRKLSEEEKTILNTKIDRLHSIKHRLEEKVYRKNFIVIWKDCWLILEKRLKHIDYIFDDDLIIATIMTLNRRFGVNRADRNELYKLFGLTVGILKNPHPES